MDQIHHHSGLSRILGEPSGVSKDMVGFKEQKMTLVKEFVVLAKNQGIQLTHLDYFEANNLRTYIL
jgi:hypothetical protein